MIRTRILTILVFFISNLIITVANAEINLIREPVSKLTINKNLDKFKKEGIRGITIKPGYSCTFSHSGGSGTGYTYGKDVKLNLETESEHFSLPQNFSCGPEGKMKLVMQVFVNTPKGTRGVMCEDIATKSEITLDLMPFRCTLK